MGNVSIYLKELKESFSKWYNKKNERKGTIWTERFGCTMVQAGTKAVFSMAAYIDLNPVRAGLVVAPEDYQWSGLTSALDGNQGAQRGIESLYGNGRRWEELAGEYRARVYVSGGVARQPGKVVLGDETIQKALEELAQAEGANTKAGKNRYFSEGVVLWSQEFVDQIFEENWKGTYSRRTEGGVEIGEGVPGLEGCFAYQKIADPVE